MPVPRNKSSIGGVLEGEAMEPINCRTEGESWEEKLQGGTPFFNVKSLISERFQLIPVSRR